jgi:diadenosine tetraphosphatase ApaH/serine/threonine PP2A family protein phosphatase
LDSEVSFFGHTHLQGGFLCHRNGVVTFPGVDDGAQEQAIQLEHDSTYLINPGSVGQPRDGDPRAAYAVYQPEARLVTLFRTVYDVATAQGKILQAGLPELLAARLEAGV